MKDKKANKPVIDVFKGLKFVDNLLEEAAAKNIDPKMKDNFEAKLKARLLGESTDDLNENRYTDDANYEYPNYEYGGISEAPGDEATPEAPADDMGGKDLPVEDMPADDMGGEDLGAIGGAAGTDALPAEPVDSEELPGEEGVEDVEDIEALVDELIDQDITEMDISKMGGDDAVAADPNSMATSKAPADSEQEAYKTIDEVMVEMDEMDEAKECKCDGECKCDVKDAISEDIDGVKDGTKLSDKDLGNSIAKASKVDQSKAQGNPDSAKLGADYKDLGDDDLKGSIAKGEKESANEKAEPTKVAGAANVDQSKSQGDTKKATPDHTVVKDAKASYSTLKKEGVVKSKALYVLAEKYLTLEDQNKALKLESHKAVKANGILTLAPDTLKESTRIKLVQKFDECKSIKEVNDLYNKAVSLIKESIKIDSVDQVIGKDKTVKSLNESTQSSGKTEPTEFEKRQAFLSGNTGYEKQYGNC